MEKLTPADGASPDIVAENIERLRDLFPEVFIDGSIDFDALKQTLGEYVDDREERYSFTWHGKHRARKIAQVPSSGTLLPCPKESVNWDTTKNLFIEGDNLEVLKLLQKSYHRKVKMIYIDPPYNTGGEFIYPDKYQDNLDTYLKYTGQVDDDGFKLSANSETSGRYHTNWLNMMYPRLKLARNLLRDDGVIFVSIDDNEAANLLRVLDEIFGEENFVGNFIWKSRKFTDARSVKNISTDHEYIVCYARSELSKFRGRPRDESKYKNPDNDPLGPWMSRSILGLATRDQRPNLHYPIVDPDTDITYEPPASTGWRYSTTRMLELIESGYILFPKKPSGRPREKKFRADILSDYTSFQTVISDVFTEDGTQEIRKIFGSQVFDFPKPSKLIQRLVEQGADKKSIVLDFFSGSCSTAEACISSNLESDLSLSFIMVQLPEPTGNKSQAKAAGLDTIADLGKERIRRVLRSIEVPIENADCSNLGFKVFKLSSSNIKPWDAEFDSMDTDMVEAIDNIKPDRSSADVLYELLLKYGLDLAIPIDERTISGKTVYVIGAGALVVCLDNGVNLNLVQGIVDLKQELAPEVMRVVFKDSGFETDVVKTNTVQILKQAGIDDVKSL